MRPRKRVGRPRSIRALLAALFVVPLASLLALWGFAASVTLSDALQEHDFSSADRLYGGAAETLGIQLTQERLQVYVWLSSAGHSPEIPMLTQFRTTQAAVATFRNKLRISTGLIDGTSRPALAAFNTALNGLPALRTRVTSGKISALTAFQAYNAIVGTELRFFTKLTVVANTPLYIQAAATVQAGRALDLAEREITLISGALATGGQMSQPERLLFAQEAADRQLLMTDALGQLQPALSAGFVRTDASSAYRSFAAMEQAVSASVGVPGPIPVSPAAFSAAAVPLFRDYQAASRQDGLALSRLGERAGGRVLIELALAGGVGLLAIAVSALLMARFGRRISRELTRLQRAALELAGERLPAVVDRLSQGEDVDVAAETTPLAPGRIREITKVAEAFATVQGTAIEAAAGQARLRRGINRVFLSLAWRSQSLLHRQLALLDVMERKTSDPAALDELFQLDHLTTRMRRHAEGLVILSGAAPARGWRSPVPIMDVLRGAIAEIEDYARITVVTEAQDAVTGPAVADVIHLLAELIENGAAYSPRSTEVTVRAGRVARGLAVEVDDRGVGIPEDELAAVNQRLASAAEFDLAETDQLGLFVVSRLAAKHGIRVTLRASPFGGTTAIVLLPHGITVGAGSDPSAAQPEPAAESVFLPYAQRRRASLAARVPPRVTTWVSASGAVSAGPERDSTGPADPAPDNGQVTDVPDRGGVVAGSARAPLPRRVRPAARDTRPSAERVQPSRQEQPAAAPALAEPEASDPAASRALAASLGRGWQRARLHEPEAAEIAPPATQPEEDSEAR
jgi:signal transduction histidine kinase